MNKNNIKIYDYFYKEMAKKENIYSVLSSKFKSDAIDDIFSEGFDIEEKQNIELCIHNMGYLNKGIWKNHNKKKAMRKFEKSVRHMYNPKNIAKAIPGYYNKPEAIMISSSMEITKEDFGGKKYIVTALNKSGIIYKSQLKKHLSNGWRFLWTIPGIGPGAMWTILEAVDDGFLDRDNKNKHPNHTNNI